MNWRDTLVPFYTALPLCGAFLIPMVSRKVRWFADFFAILILTLLVAGCGALFGHQQVYTFGNWPAPYGIVLVLDPLSWLLLFLVNLIGLMAAIFSVPYIERLYTSKLRYCSLFLLMIAGMNGMVLTGDLFNLFVFMEIATIASYALVGFGCEARELEASFKYLVIGTIGSSFILLAIALLYGKTATLNMADIARQIAPLQSDPLVLFSFVLCLVGFFIKAAVVPFHAWLPDAHPSAPSPVSAMLSGVVIKAVGVYALVRLVFNVFGFSHLTGQILVGAGILSMMVGVILAVNQWDFKRLLAYHSVSQIGYVILGIGLGTPLGIAGGLFHLFNHSLFKSLLFLDSGSVEYETGTRDLNRMGDLAQKMPVTSLSTLVASLSISGIPPFNGFWSKLLIILACVQAGRPGAALWAVAGSILTLSSFTKVLRYAFFGRGQKFDEASWKEYREVPVLMLVPTIFLALLCLAASILAAGGEHGFFGDATGVLLRGAGSYITTVLGGQG